MPQAVKWRTNQIPLLVAGTAQLGMKYGIANACVEPNAATSAAVIDMAWDCGIRFFDTAQAYGESEAFVGMALRKRGVSDTAQVISKLDPKLNAMDSKSIQAAVRLSVERRGAPLWAMLLHRPDWLDFWDQGLGIALREVQREGLVKYLGVSVYTVEEARRVLNHEAMDVVQVPASAWDQRMLHGGIFHLAAVREKLCFVRSIFLQGLLTLSAQVAAERLPIAFPAAEAWERICQRYALSPEALAVRCALAFSTPLVVGMETAEQVRANIKLFDAEPLSDGDVYEIQRAMSGVLDDRILNPSRWQEAS